MRGPEGMPPCCGILIRAFCACMLRQTAHLHKLPCTLPASLDKVVLSTEVLSVDMSAAVVQLL